MNPDPLLLLSTLVPSGSPGLAFSWFLLLAVGLGAIGLSFTRRWGRSRWPFHVIITSAIVCLAWGDINRSVAGHSFQVLALGLGLVAVIRALIATFREPGPRY